jgi:glycosyltransferase involved in cell wall biosynthesis
MLRNPADVELEALMTKKLGVYTDSLHATIDVDGSRTSGVAEGDAPFLVFVAEVARDFDRTFVFGRNIGSADEAFVPVPGELEILPLPPYASLRELWNVLGATLGTAKAFWRGLGDVDIVWCFGPHPFGLLLALLALARRKRVVLGIRQDPIRYFEARGQGTRRWKMAMVRLSAWSFWLLSRRLPVTAVGEALSNRYRGSEVLDLKISLTRASDVAIEPRAIPGGGEDVHLLTVGRIAPEKNPELLLRALRQLNDVGERRFLLTWAGTGELAEEALRLSGELELDELVTFAGHIPFGPALAATYRTADIFVHVALTEGLPQVLLEAFAAGLPAIATDVGGVRAATGDGRRALLVGPADLKALVNAVRQLAASPEDARTIAEAGLEFARMHTLEHEAARAARFVRGESKPVQERQAAEAPS